MEQSCKLFGVFQVTISRWCHLRWGQTRWQVAIIRPTKWPQQAPTIIHIFKTHNILQV